MTTEPHLSSVEGSPIVSNDWRKREIRLAFANAVKLGISMIATWGIALVARLYIPRFLGPDRFGALNFADAFTATAFVIMGFGVDTYVRKEISVRPEHANDFVGGIIVLRLLLLPFAYVAMEITMRARHCNLETRQLVYVYGAIQFFMLGSATSAGLLQAVGKVNEISVLSVVAKLAWLAASLVVLRLGLWYFAVTVAILEGAKSFILYRLARKYLKFELRVSPRATWAVIIAALPFFVSGLATSVYDKIGVNLLAFMTSEREVGWFGAASGLAGMTLLLTPLVAWVLIPLFARSAAESQDALFDIIRRSLELILALSIPLSLMMMLGADTWVSLLFGHAFIPAATALRVLALSTVLMYLSIVAAYALAVLNYTWRMSLVFVGGMLINPTCNLILIRRMSAIGGPGAGGAACATATLITEIVISASLISMLGRRCFDRRLILATSKSVIAALAVIALNTILAKLPVALRLAIDVVVYSVLALASGAIDFRQVIRLVRSRSHENPAASTPNT